MLFAANAEVMPPLPVTTLSGDSLVIPPQTANAPSLFVIGFSKKSRAQTSLWTQLLERDDPDGEPPYQVAILDDVPRFVRGLIVHAIRKAVPERLHKRFLIVFEKADVWKQLAGFLDPDGAYLLVIGPHRQVVWRTEGKPTEERFQALLQALRTARSQLSPP
jgi:hypothetical protein